MLEKAIEFVNTSFKGKDIPHHERTLYWVLHFRPEADESLQIAAYSHDIERAFRNEKGISAKESGDPLIFHQEHGGEIMADFLEKNGAQDKVIKRVKMLISKHEYGGDEDQNLLKDCDSLSFFETNYEGFVKEKWKRMGKDKVREKLDWMYNRISSKEAKKIAEPKYKKAVEMLDSAQ